MPHTYQYEEIALDLESRIASGEFPPGSRLPSRRELLIQYAPVSEPVIDRAFQILRVKGLIRTRLGVGVFVADTGTEK